LGRPRVHPPRPVAMVAVADDERQRRPERAAVAEAREHLDLVGLDLLPRAAAVALLAAAEVLVDGLAVEREARGKPFDDCDEGRPVRLARCGERQGHARKPKAARITSTGAGTPVQRWNAAAPWRTSASRPSITTSQPAARAAATSAVSSAPYARSTTAC